MGTTNLDKLELSQELVLTDEVLSFTVGAGKDFETFDKAMKYVLRIPVSGRTRIELTLDDGVHEIAEPDELSQYAWAYYIVSNYIRIIGSARAACTITMPATDDGDQWPAMFSVELGGFLTFEKLTIDPGASGYPYPTHISPGYAGGGGAAYIDDVLFTNADGAFYAGSNGYVKIYGSTLDSNTAGYAQWGSGAVGVLQSCTISNNTTGVNVSGQLASQVRLQSCTLTGNTADYGVPLNEIQYTGSYITNGSSALSFKA